MQLAPTRICVNRFLVKEVEREATVRISLWPINPISGGQDDAQDETELKPDQLQPGALSALILR
jgi:hypothetical protein